MKNLFSFLFFISIGSAVIAQSKEIIIKLDHYYNGEEFIVAEYNSDESETFLVDNQSYLVNGNTPIKFFRMQYYLHINSVMNSNGESTAFNDTYLLVDPSQEEYNIGAYEVSDVNSLLFHLGVAPEVNHNDPTLLESSNPLAPQSPNMHWGWVAGYIFIAVEAMVDEDEDGTLETVLQYHAVDDTYYSELSIANAVVETETTITIYMDVNYDKMFENMNSSEGGVFHGVYDENMELITNIINNEVFTVPVDLNLDEKRISSDVFPNPFTNDIQLFLNENSTIKLFDVLGNLIEVHEFKQGQQHIETEQLLKGMYVLSIESEERHENIKLLKK